LPFVFIFNTDLLLIDVGWIGGIIVAISATIAILVFTSGTMGWFLTKSRLYESVLLVAIAFALFRPDFFMNRIQPPFVSVEPSAISQALDTAKAGDELRVVVSGPDFDTGEIKDTTLVLPVPEGGTGEDRLAGFGLTLLPDGDVMTLEEPIFGTPFADTLSSFDFYGDELVTLVSVNAPASQMPKELVFIPALMLLGLVAFLQKSRMGREEEVAA
jgi:hypothetical protein